MSFRNDVKWCGGLFNWACCCMFIGAVEAALGVARVKRALFPERVDSEAQKYSTD
jgi:hypothetical protein